MMLKSHDELVWRRFVPSRVLLVAILVVTARLAIPSTAGAEANDLATIQLPAEKQTTLGLYVTAREAYERWRAAPEKVKVLDVRTTEEFLFIGHAEMAWNIPLMSQTHEWDADKQYFAMEPNPDFIDQVKEFAQPSDTILVMCRSGGRSAMAVNKLAEAGFTSVYSITDGMEGDAVDDPESVYLGQRLRNGWKNSGIPWTYQPNRGHMRFVTTETKE